MLRCEAKSSSLEKSKKNYPFPQILPKKSLIERLRVASRKTRSAGLKKFIKTLEEDRLDAGQVMGGLMAVFRDTRSMDIYTLLYELNFKSFLGKVYCGLKRYHSLSDPQDILQEVFISIYRYAKGFREEHRHSFRNWTQTIIRNAILKHLNRTRKVPPPCEIEQDIVDEREDASPLERMIRTERYHEFGKLYFLSLSLYLHQYNKRLNAREKTALHKVEVENLPYKDSAKAMGVKLENFKMIVCRARKKIYAGIQKDWEKQGFQVMAATG
jgi:RNA polymerase sigma factor (sigma-70 family)